MDIEEQERMLGQTVLRIREKETERRCLQRRADDLTQALGKILALHSQNKHDDEPMMRLKQLPKEPRLCVPPIYVGGANGQAVSQVSEPYDTTRVLIY